MTQAQRRQGYSQPETEPKLIVPYMAPSAFDYQGQTLLVRLSAHDWQPDWTTGASTESVTLRVEVRLIFTCYDSCTTCSPSYFSRLGHAKGRLNLTSSDSQLTFSLAKGDQELVRASHRRSVGECARSLFFLADRLIPSPPPPTL